MPVVTGQKLGLAWMALLSCPCAVSAQEVADPSQPTSLSALFDRKPSEKRLQCNVRPSRDQNSGTFGVLAGYTTDISQVQYPHGGPHTWLSAIRVRPENPPGNAVYLVKTMKRDGSQDGVDRDGTVYFHMILSDSFWVGKGRYAVDLVTSDDLGGICRKEWRLNANPAFNISLAPGVVMGTSTEDLARQLSRDPRPRLSRLTVLLDAAPWLVLPNRLPQRLDDLDFLLGGLTEILLELPAASVRLICFSLDQQTEIFRDEDFHLDSLGRVSDSLKGLSLATLNASLRSGGHLAMLARMINEEIRGTPPSDAVIFFGPQERFRDAIPEEDLLPRSGHPQFFYLRPELGYFVSFPNPSVWDGSIAKAIGSVGGKTIDFARDLPSVDLPHMIERIRRIVLPQSN